MVKSTGEPELVGITTTAVPPIGFVHVPLQRGLNVVYGKNGVGKTRLLRSIRDHLGRWISASERSESAPSPSEAFYVHGGVHLRATDEAQVPPGLRHVLGASAFDDHWPKRDLEAEINPLIVGRISGALLQPQAPATKGDFRAFVRSVAATRPGWENHLLLVDQLLDGGHWFVSRTHVSDHFYLAVDPTSAAGEVFAASQDLPPGLPRLSATLGHGDIAPTSLPVLHIASHHLVDEEMRDSGALVHVASDVGAAPAVSRHHLAREADVEERLILANLGWFDAAGRPTDRARELAQRRALRAQQLLEELIGDAPRLTIEFEASPTDERVGTWQVVERGHRFPIADLGSAHQRFARLAISWIDDRSVGAYFHSIAILDEPELALHPGAVDGVARALANGERQALVATHSPRVWYAASSTLVMRRDAHGEAFLSALPATPPEDFKDLEWLALDLGVSPVDLMQAVRVFVLVEGPHDRAVLSEVLVDVLVEGDVQIMSLGGTHGLDHVAASSVLFGVTSATFVVVVDNASADWSEKQCRKARRGHSLGGAQTEEERHLLALLDRATELGQLGRIRLAPLAKRDISHYLPVERVIPGYTRWEDAEADFLAARGNGKGQWRRGDGVEFKAWAREEAKRAIGQPWFTTNGLSSITQDLVAEARERGLDGTLHPDFARIADAIRDARAS